MMSNPSFVFSFLLLKSFSSVLILDFLHDISPLSNFFLSDKHEKRVRASDKNYLHKSSRTLG